MEIVVVFQRLESLEIHVHIVSIPLLWNCTIVFLLFSKLPKPRLCLRVPLITNTQKKPRDIFDAMDIAQNSLRTQTNVFTLRLCILMNVYSSTLIQMKYYVTKILLLSVTLHKRRMFTHCCMHNLCIYVCWWRISISLETNKKVFLPPTFFLISSIWKYSQRIYKLKFCCCCCCCLLQLQYMNDGNFLLEILTRSINCFFYCFHPYSVLCEMCGSKQVVYRT